MAMSRMKTCELTGSEQKVLWVLRMMAEKKSSTPSIVLRFLHEWFGLANIERSFVAFERLVGDLCEALGEVVGSVRQSELVDEEMRILSLVAACQEGPTGFGGRIARELVGPAGCQRLHVNASELGRLTADAGLFLPVRLAWKEPSRTILPALGCAMPESRPRAQDYTTNIVLS